MIVCSSRRTDEYLPLWDPVYELGLKLQNGVCIGIGVGSCEEYFHLKHFAISILLYVISVQEGRWLKFICCALLIR